MGISILTVEDDGYLIKTRNVYFSVYVLHAWLNDGRLFHKLSLTLTLALIQKDVKSATTPSRMMSSQSL